MDVYSVFDVVAYVISKLGSISAMKLQRLIYYIQAWSLVWDKQPVFQEPIEAWANGPIISDLFYFQRSNSNASLEIAGDFTLLNAEQKKTIDAVLEQYGDKTAQWLTDLVNQESPWKETQKIHSQYGKKKLVISLHQIQQYYSSIVEY